LCCRRRAPKAGRNAILTQLESLLQAALHRAAGMIEPREEKRDNATSQRDFSSLVLVLVNFNEIERARARARAKSSSRMKIDSETADKPAGAYTSNLDSAYRKASFRKHGGEEGGGGGRAGGGAGRRGMLRRFVTWIIIMIYLRDR